ncbi:MAG TPA: hypothetical protein DD725_05965 [Deltaproteobacteria bacterium]|nr:hypothetical protein [Deltaproteobacteria bacterium]
MALVDKSLILRKIGDLELYQKQIEEFSGINVQSYSDDWKTQRIVERTLQMMVEICVDIANHIVSDRVMRIPTGYSDTFKVLFENGVIDRGLFDIMEKMAKFRNIVVHQYEKVDAEIVIIILKKHLTDFEKFREAILSYLKKI